MFSYVLIFILRSVLFSGPSVAGTHVREIPRIRNGLYSIRPRHGEQKAVSDVKIGSMHSNAIIGPGPINSGTTGNILFFIFDEADLRCPLCQGSILELCDSLAAYSVHVSIAGLCVYRNSGADTSRQMEKRVIRKQIHGFFQGNHIPFPVVFDETSLFLPLIRNHPMLLLIQTEFGIVKNWAFPLSPQDMEEMISLIQ